MDTNKTIETLRKRIDECDTVSAALRMDTIVQRLYAAGCLSEKEAARLFVRCLYIIVKIEIRDKDKP